MAIEFSCSHCNTTLRVPDEHAGKSAKCPKCQTLNTIQAAGTPFAPEAASPFHASFQAPPNKPVGANPYAASQSGMAPQAPRGYAEQHRGSTVLTLGIVSLFCNILAIPGILAWIYGRADLKKMDAGQMNIEGRGITQAGMILGIIGTVLAIVVILFYVLIFVIAIAGAGLENM